MLEEPCDCSPECCRSQDTSYHKHVRNTCVHIDGTSHIIDKSTDNVKPSCIMAFKEKD